MPTLGADDQAARGLRHPARHGRRYGAAAGIERLAAALMAPYAAEEASDNLVTADAVLLASAVAAGRLWIATHGPDVVGSALATVEDGEAHLHELDVLPAHGRRGLGAALVETVCEWAASAGFAGVTLSTRQDVPFNGSFYARLGFAVVPDGELTPGLSELRAEEARRGLDISQRAIMRRSVIAIGAD